MRRVVVTICGLISILAVACGLLIGGFLILSPSGGGFLPDLGWVVGILVLALGNLISLICGGICWFAGRRSHWLAVTLLLQTVLAILTVIWIVYAA